MTKVSTVKPFIALHAVTRMHDSTSITRWYSSMSVIHKQRKACEICTKYVLQQNQHNSIRETAWNGAVTDTQEYHFHFWYCNWNLQATPFAVSIRVHGCHSIVFLYHNRCACLTMPANNRDQKLYISCFTHSTYSGFFAFFWPSSHSCSW